MPTDAVQLRPAVLLGTERREPFGAVAQDRRHVAKRLDVVDRRRRAVQPRTGWEWRFQSRLRALAFERLEERGLLTSFVCAGAAMYEDVALPSESHHVSADIALPVGLFELLLEHVLHVKEFAADVDVGNLRADCVAGDQATFEQQ